MNKIIENITLDDITAFLQKGKLDNAPEGVSEYLVLLDKTRGMLQRFNEYPNDDIIINFLVAKDGLTKYKARNIIAEAREFFYHDKVVSEQAWRNIAAEKAEKVIHLSMLCMKDVKDGKAIIDMLHKQLEMRLGDGSGAGEIPEELLNRKMWNIYTTDITDLGLPKANRNETKELINSKFLDLSEKEKTTIYREMDTLPFKLFPNVEENARKS